MFNLIKVNQFILNQDNYPLFMIYSLLQASGQLFLACQTSYSVLKQGNIEISKTACQTRIQIIYLISTNQSDMNSCIIIVSCAHIA